MRTYSSFFYYINCIPLTVGEILNIDKKEILEKKKETIDLEYELICDFIKLRHELGLTQQQMADEAGVI